MDATTLFLAVLMVISNIIFASLGFLAGKGELATGILPATKRLVRGSKGAVLRDEPTPEERAALKEKYLKDVQTNPVLPLPEGLTPDDFK